MKYSITVDVPDELEELLRGARHPRQDEPSRRKPSRSEPEPDDVDDAVDDADDPWGEPRSQKASRKPQESRRRPESRPAGDDKGNSSRPRKGVFRVDTGKGVRVWKFGPDAPDDTPECYCGMQAAYVKGKSGSRKWAAFWCPLKYSKDTYKGACDFSQWSEDDDVDDEL